MAKCLIRLVANMIGRKQTLEKRGIGEMEKSEIIAAGCVGIAYFCFYIYELRKSLTRETKERAYLDHLSRRFRRAMDEVDPLHTQHVLNIVDEEWKEAHRQFDGAIDYDEPYGHYSIPDLWRPYR